MVHKLRGHYEINPSYPALRYAELGSLDNLFSNIHYKFIDHFEEIAIYFVWFPPEHSTLYQLNSVYASTSSLYTLRGFSRIGIIII